MSPLVESIKRYVMPKRQISWVWNEYGFAAQPLQFLAKKSIKLYSVSTKVS